jgi:hypothetical protein
MTDRSDVPRERERTGAWAGALLFVPILLCCGLPLMVATAGGLIAWMGLHGVALGAMAAVGVCGGAIATWRARHEGAAACTACESGSAEGGRYGAGTTQDQEHAMS